MEKEILRKLEHYCAYQERCHVEVERKLRDLGVYGEQQPMYIAHLIEHNFLNEERFAELFVRSKFNQKKWGNIRLKLELQQRQIHSRLIDKALKNIPKETYLNTFFALAEKVWESTQGTNHWVKKSKVSASLSRKGYEFELIQEFLEDKSN